MHGKVQASIRGEEDQEDSQRALAAGEEEEEEEGKRSKCNYPPA